MEAQMKRLAVFLLFSVFLFVGAGTAQAIPYIYTFGGTVTETGSAGLASISVGDPFAGSFFYSYETFGQNTDPDGHQATYVPILEGYSIFVGDLFVYGGHAVPGSNLIISINDGPVGDSFRAYDINPDSNASADRFINEVWIMLSDSTGTAFTDTSLPFPLDASAFDSGRINFLYSCESCTSHLNNFWGDIDTLQVFPPAPVPEPSTLVLLGSGLAGLGGMAWRRRNRT
jgi:hypothetical protein